jgi:hypothetical protein
MPVPRSLRTWFTIHFVVDVLFAFPLMIAPMAFLKALGWSVIDPFTARLVGAALAGIGGASFLSRNEDVSVFRALLNLKIIWSITALIGMIVTLVSGAPQIGWGVVSLYLLFGIVWIRYRSVI